MEEYNKYLDVAPLVGAWIEMSGSIRRPEKSSVAPLVGAWIEIRITGTRGNASGSLPSWERGLKSSALHSPDAHSKVAPLVGAWIEISTPLSKDTLNVSLPSWERGLK